MASPFDDDCGIFLVLVNGADHCALWPAYLDAPAGWAVAYGTGTRQACLDYVAGRAGSAETQQ